MEKKKKTHLVWTLFLAVLIAFGVALANLTLAAYADVKTLDEHAKATKTDMQSCNDRFSIEIEAAETLNGSTYLLNNVATKVLELQIQDASFLRDQLSEEIAKFSKMPKMDAEFDCDKITKASVNRLDSAKTQVLLSLQQNSTNQVVHQTSTDVKQNQEKQQQKLDQMQTTLDRQERRENEFLNSNPKCSQEEFRNAEGVTFSGCTQPLSGDQFSGTWKRWEDALKDGDLCIYDDPVSKEKIAKPKEEC
ncbi:MAG: hypothetical protein LBQ41_01995 [Candidatus Ancillula sp.]|jgi:hypothetical protein|nr:hypothetical protein [Candidatus Ancillula sp.]